MQDTMTKKSIFILSGQSNMAGRGGVIRRHLTENNNITQKQWDGIIPEECNPHACILRMNGHFTWEQAREPLHADIDTKKTTGIGPGMIFANQVLKRVGGVVGLVPCAVGGTVIREWARGEELYESMVKRSKESVKDGDGEIKCVLWYQGESDALCEEDALAYGDKMKRLVMDFRDVLGLPDLPFIQVALASGNERYVEFVRKAQLEMDIPNVVCVDAKGLPLLEDHLHLTTEAQIKLGHMLAEAYLNHFASK